MFGRYIHTMVLRKRDDQNRNLGCKILKPNPVKLQGGPITANWLILILGRYLPNMFIWYYFSVGISYTMTKYSTIPHEKLQVVGIHTHPFYFLFFKFRIDMRIIGFPCVIVGLCFDWQWLTSLEGDETPAVDSATRGSSLVHTECLLILSLGFSQHDSLLNDQ